VKRNFPESTLDFYEDRDCSVCDSFAEREGYRKMRIKMMSGEYDMLIVKDFLCFSRRNSKGLAELENLRNAGMRIISIEDGIDCPNDDEWQSIQICFMFNEIPVT
jgi:DNA invertase Pin-like site-specific DNA recombinase